MKERGKGVKKGRKSERKREGTGREKGGRGKKNTNLTTTISHDNNNHRTTKHAITSWRSDGSPSCLGGS